MKKEVKKLPRAEFYNVSCNIAKNIDTYQFFMFGHILKAKYSHNGKDIGDKDFIQVNLN